jgi:hypothetical protein
MTYPDGFDALVNVNANDTLAGGGHAARHNSVNTALEELADVLTVPATNTLALVPDGTTERFRIDSAGLITGAGTSLGAWTAYTPTLGGTGWALGNGTADAKYCQVGKIVIFRIRITFGSTSTFGAGALQVSLPVSTNAATLGNFVCQFRDQSTTTQYFGVSRLASATAVQIESIGTNGFQSGVTSSVPFTWENTDVLRIQGTYEAG